MVALAKYSSSAIVNLKRILKSIGIGGSVMTTKESYPFGFDSCPPEGITAIYAETSNRDEAVIIGYINKGQLASIGESRMYAVGSNGELLGFVYCKDSGVTGINGFEHSTVRFGPLQTSLNSQNTLINAELLKIQNSIAALGGSYTRANVSININSSESETVKIK